MSEKMAALPTTRETVVSAGIQRLVNQTFERFSDDLAEYAADERRDREKSGGTTLTSDNEGVIWEGGTYGKLPIEITDDDCLQKVYKAFLGHPVTRRGMMRPETTHYEMIHQANQLGDPYRYTSIGATLLLYVLRDRYPKDETDWRESLMSNPEDYSGLPESLWGERHKAGVELRVGYRDAWAPEHPTQWRFGIFLQTRFDKPEPQHEIRSELSGMLHASTQARDFEGRQQRVRRARLADVLRVTELFEMAEDIHPLVTPIDQLLESRAEVGEMAKNFFERSEESTATA